jgi:AcrR family transcriptional regulator
MSRSTPTATPTASAPEPAASEHEPRSRAAALPRGERRAAIVEATLPLLITHGSGVTSRQIAEAAGVAEGTIFRVFTDKEELLEAVGDLVFDPAPTQTALRRSTSTNPRASPRCGRQILQRQVTVI